MAEAPPEVVLQGSCAAFRAIAHLAPTLRERDLRVLIALSLLFADKPDRSGSVSTRDLASGAGLSRSNVRLSIEFLARQGTIAITPATATTPTNFRLVFVDLEIIGGPSPGPPPVEKPLQVGLFQAQGGSIPGPPPLEIGDGVGLVQAHPAQNEGSEVGLFQAQGGSIPGPPPYKERASARASIDRLDLDSIFDRLLKANPKKTDPADLEHARRWIYGYQCKFGRNESPQSGPYRPHPPDDLTCAQLCAILSPIQIENLIHELSAERKQPGHSPQWYVTVALQRRYGIAPAVLKERRAQLRIARDRGHALTGEQQSLDQLANPGLDANPQFRDQLLRDVAEQRKAKGAR